MLPADHPLHTPVKLGVDCRIKRHKAPIHLLWALFKQDPNRVEKIPATARDPAQHGKSPFQVSIAKDRAGSIEEANNTVEDIQIFTDGSAVTLLRALKARRWRREFDY